MDIEFSNMIMYIVMTILVLIGVGIWFLFGCKLESSFSKPLISIIIIIGIFYSYVFYNLNKDCKKVNCNIR
jgi:hypothetical protein